MFEFPNAVVHPYMPDERLHIATHSFSVVVGALGTQYTGIRPVYAIAVAFCNETILDMEAALNVFVVFKNLPRFSWRKLQRPLTVWTVWR